jgi:transporter family-2 protein
MALGALAISTGGLEAALPNVGGQPLWRLTGGFLGAGAIFCTVMLAPRLGLATLLALVIAGQLLSAITIDHFGLLGVMARPATPARLVGATIMTFGVLLALFGDRILSAIRLNA